MDQGGAVTASRVPRAAYVAWLVGLTAYVMAVFNRTSFGVAVIPAADRFHASASSLAFFTVVQLIVYAGLQVPVGVMLDRVGPKRLILGGAVLMSLGQFGLAASTSVGPAIAMRVLVGAGDAVTFISVLRVVTDVFPGPRVPVLTQLTGIFGQLGGILSALPLAAALSSQGWTRSFDGMGAIGVVVAVLVLVALHVETDEPANAPGARQAWEQVKGAWRHPGTRLGLWTHFTTQFSANVFALLWGFPFLINGEGQTRGSASMLLTVNVIAGVVISPVLGRMVGRHPLRRSWMVLGIIVSGVVGWTIVLAWPGQAPLWVLVLLVLSIAAGGPGSMIGFDFARTFNPSERLGTASGIVNVGGFVASLLLMFLIGIVLDIAGTGPDYSLGAFRWAFSLQYVFWAFGVVAILVSRRKTIEREQIAIPKIRDAMARELRARRERRTGEDR